MSPAEIRAHPAIADKPASREIRNPLAAVARVAAVVVAAAMPDAAAVEAEAVAEEIAAARRSS
jgi:hypothetical protein